MSDTPQPTTSFAKAHQQSLDLTKRAWAAADIVTYGEMPDFTANPVGWRSRMRARMGTSKIIQRVGLGMRDESLRIILDDTFTHLEQMDCMGNEDMVWPQLRKEVRDHLKRRRLAKWARAEREIEQQEQRAAVIAYGALLDVPQVEISRILVRVRTKSVQWVDECKRELDVWKRQHAEPLPDASKVYADGFESDTVAATATMKEYEAKEAERKAAKQPSVLDAAFPRDANGEPIDLPQESNNMDDPATQALADRVGKSTADNLSSDPIGPKLETLVGANEEPTVVWSAVDKPEGKQQTPAFVHFRRELLIIDPKADTTTHILKALGEPLGPHIEAHGIALTCGKLQEYLNDLNDKFRNAPEPQGATKAPPPPAIPVPGSTSDASEVALVRSETMPQKEIVGTPQHLLKVYPADFGSIIHKGIKFSVTLCSDDATWEDAIVLMDRFAAHADQITAECKVQSPPANVTPLPQVAPQLPTLAPTAQPNVTPGTPDGKGRVPGGVGSTVVTGVEVSKKNGKLIVELWSTGKYPEHSLKLDAEHAMITALGYSVEKMEIGTRYPINWTSDWIVSGNRANDGKGNYYLNVTGIRDNAVSVPKIA